LYLNAQPEIGHTREYLLQPKPSVVHKCESSNALEMKRHDASVDALAFIALIAAGIKPPKESMERKRAYITMELLHPFEQQRP
jgi:hypothetical protein